MIVKTIHYLVCILLLTSACAGNQAKSTRPAEWLALNQEFIRLYAQGDYDRALITAQREVDLAGDFLREKMLT